MSQQNLGQPDVSPNTDKNTAVTIYQTQQNAAIAIRDLERFEKELVRLPHRGAHGMSSASGGKY